MSAHTTAGFLSLSKECTNVATGGTTNLHFIMCHILLPLLQTVKSADDLVLMAKKEKVLQGMIDKLIETGRYYGMEINVEKTKVMRISRQASPITITIDQKQVENVKCFKYLGSMLTEDGRCTCEIKSRIAMAKAVFNKKKNLFTSKLDFNLRKRLVRCYV